MRKWIATIALIALMAPVVGATCQQGTGQWPEFPVSFSQGWVEDEDGYCWPRQGGQANPCTDATACTAWVTASCAQMELGVQGVEWHQGLCGGHCNPYGYVTYQCGN